MKKVNYAALALFVMGPLFASAQTAPQTTTPAADQSTTQTPSQVGTQGTAQTNTTTTAPATQTEDKTEVTIEELPEGVKKTLSGSTLKPWTPTEAYLIKTPDGKEYYAINLKKEEETGSVKLDKEGKPVK